MVIYQLEWLHKSKLFVLTSLFFFVLYMLVVQNVADEFYGAMSMCVDVAEETGGQLVPQCHHLVLEQHNEGHSQQSLTYGISLKSTACNYQIFVYGVNNWVFGRFELPTPIRDYPRTFLPN